MLKNKKKNLRKISSKKLRRKLKTFLKKNPRLECSDRSFVKNSSFRNNIFFRPKTFRNFEDLEVFVYVKNVIFFQPRYLISTKNIFLKFQKKKMKNRNILECLFRHVERF